MIWRSRCVRYYRGRGFTRLAMITSTDASGQDGAHGFEETMKLPENKDMKLVRRPNSHRPM